MATRRAFFNRYKPPGVDSPRARANATTFLVCARTLEHITPEWFAFQYRLKPTTAATMLDREKQRRTAR